MTDHLSGVLGDRKFMAQVRRVYGDDVVQDALLRVCKTTGPEVSRSFLSQALHFAKLDARRKVDRRPTVQLGDPSTAHSFADNALLSLSHYHRIVVYLAYAWKLTQAETAQALDTSRGSVIRDLGAARAALAGRGSREDKGMPRFLALKRTAAGWVPVAMIEAEDRQAARRALRPMARGCELVGSDMETETL